MKKEKIINFLKLYLHKIVIFLVKYKYVFLLSLPFILMDLITRIFGTSIHFYKLYRIAPNLFTITWIILFVGLTLGFKKKIGKRIFQMLNLNMTVENTS